MSLRRVVLAADPLSAACRSLPGLLPVTPNRHAHAALGARGRPTSLHRFALAVLEAQGLYQAEPLQRLSAMRDAVAEVLGPRDLRGTARRLEPVVAEVMRAGGAPDVYAGATALSRRATEVLDVARRYRALLAADGAFDPADAMLRAAAATSRERPLLVAGYTRLGTGEAELVAAAAGEGSCVVLPAGFAATERVARRLAADGWSVEHDDELGPGVGSRAAASFTSRFGATAPGPAPLPAAGAVRALRLPNEEDEVRAVLARVAELIGTGVDPARVVLIARDERSYGPLVAAAAFELNLDVRLAYAVSVRETRIGEVLSLLSEAVGGRLPFEPTARLLRHPMVVGLSDEALSAARGRHPAGVEEWSAIGVEAAASLVWPEHASVGEFADRLEATLEGLGVRERLGGRDGRAYVKLMGELRPRDGAAREARLSLPGFLARLGDALDTVGVALESSRRGAVELHSPLAVFGSSYDHVFVLGMAEGSFPEPVSDDPVIDLFERRTLAEAGFVLEDAEGAAEREELSFLAVLVAAQESLTLTLPETFAGKERLASPFLQAVGVPLEPHGPRPPASELEELIVDLPRTGGSARRAWDVERSRESPLPPDEFDGVVGSAVRTRDVFSASQLTTFGQCSFRWFAVNALGLKDVEEAEEDVSPATIGSIFHRTLRVAVERAGEEVRVAGDLAADDPFRAAVIRHLPDAYDEEVQRLQDGDRRLRSVTWDRQRGENLGKLRRLVASEDFIHPGARVVAVEKPFSGRWRGLDVRGFVDRIDVVGDPGAERLVFTDYKLGVSPPPGAKGASGSLSLDVQLPLYIEAAAPRLYPGIPVGSARYLSINGAKVSREVEPAKVDSEGLDHLVARFRAAQDTGAFPLDPDPRFQACLYCPFDPVCRKGPRLSRKAGAHGAPDEGSEEAA